ncbi:unnamed protein product [Lota lota]
MLAWRDYMRLGPVLKHLLHEGEMGTAVSSVTHAQLSLKVQPQETPETPRKDVHMPGTTRSTQRASDSSNSSESGARGVRLLQK